MVKQVMKMEKELRRKAQDIVTDVSELVSDFMSIFKMQRVLRLTTI
jgi:hypothetical protein